MKLNYTLDGTSLASLDVYVQSATGLFSLPKLKTPQTVDWPDRNGVIVDLKKPRYQPRTITLNCFTKGTAGVLSVINLLNTAGLKTLTVAYGTSSYSFDVYCKDGVEITKKTTAGSTTVVEFTVKLEEPEPKLFVPSDSV